MKSKGKNIKVSLEMWERLSALKHPGQSFNGLLTEMLAKLTPK